MPSMMVARWVGQNSDPIFSPFVDQSTQNFSCAGVFVVCSAVFRLTMSCCIPEIAIKSRSCAKSRRNLTFLGRQISESAWEGRATQISDRIL